MKPEAKLSVRRDPFARGELVRFTDTLGECAWCGQTRSRVYGYVWEPDGRTRPARRSDVEFWVCGLQCFDAMRR